MKYKKLKGICLYCLGCNQLELEDFEGVNKCDNYIYGGENIKK